MAELHSHADRFIEHIKVTQLAYEQRRLADYLKGFSPDYTGVQLNTSFHEDYAGLAAKITADFKRFELLEMQFKVLGYWFSGEIGYAHLSYNTRLRFTDSGRVLVDQRENLVVARHEGAGSWLLINKVVLSARNFIEDGSPGI